jgi:hypothetical protein
MFDRNGWEAFLAILGRIDGFAEYSAASFVTRGASALGLRGLKLTAGSGSLRSARASGATV